MSHFFKAVQCVCFTVFAVSAISVVHAAPKNQECVQQLVQVSSDYLRLVELSTGTEAEVIAFLEERRKIMLLDSEVKPLVGIYAKLFPTLLYQYLVHQFQERFGPLHQQVFGDLALMMNHQNSGAQVVKKNDPQNSNIEAFKKLATAQGISLEIFRVANPKSFEFIEIPKGKHTFTMGSPVMEAGRQGDENQHQVTITGGWEIAKTSVTQLQYRLRMGNNPSHFSGPAYSEGDGVRIGDEHLNANHPAESFTRQQAYAFVLKMNELGDGYEYALLTDAIWEYAAKSKGTQTTAYPYGDTEQDLAKTGWYDENSNQRTHAVGQKDPNDFGLYDANGNVWEYVQDAYTESPPSEVDPLMMFMPGSFPVIRGGSWLNDAQDSRSSRRSSFSFGTQHSDVGARLMRRRKS